MKNFRRILFIAVALLISFSAFAQTDTAGQFRITPTQPIEKLIQKALKEKPPKEKGQFAQPDLVDVSKEVPNVKLDIRYATPDNFMGVAIYPKAEAYLQRDAASALATAARKFQKYGYGLIIYDAYRPWYVTKVFYDATPKKYRDFVADPKKGSRHNRGCAVDVGLYNLRNGKTVSMPSGYDEFSDRAKPTYTGGTKDEQKHRDLLIRIMAESGFKVYYTEWWHFDYKDWEQYPIMNTPL